MSLVHSPKIVTSGLTMYVDPANPKSYNSAENLMDASEAFVTWGAANCTFVSNVITAPDGTKTADAVIASAADVGHYISKGAAGTTVSDTVYTFSIYLKHKGFDLIVFQPTFKDGTYQNIANWNLATKTATATGVGITATIKELDDGWFRVTSTFNSKTGASQINPLIYIGTYGNILGDGVKGVYAWGAQLERGTTASKYTKTTTAAITRSTSITDISVEGNNGILTNGVGYTNNNGGSLIFDGVDDYISFSTFDMTSLSPSSVTLEAWVNHNNFAVSQAYINNWFSFLSDQRGVLLRTFNDQKFPSFWWCWGTADGSNSYYSVYASNITMSTNTWYHVVGTFEKNVAARIYVNGTLNNSVTTLSYINKDIVYDTSQKFRIGQSNINSSLMNGFISQAKIYNRALSDSEIKQNFNAVRGRYGL